MKVLEDLKISKDDFRFFGSEPNITEESSECDLIIAYNWYNYVCSNDDAKQFIIDYLKTKHAKKLIILTEQIDSVALRTIGWTLRIKLRGGVLPKETEDKIFDKLDDLLKKQEIKNKTKKIDPARPIVSVQDRINSKVSEVIGDFETEIDKFIISGASDFIPETYIKINDIKPLIAKKISLYYEDLVSEIKEAVAGKDADLKQAYLSWTKPKIKKYLELINTIVAIGKQSKEIKKNKGKKHGTKRTRRRS